MQFRPGAGSFGNIRVMTTTARYGVVGYPVGHSRSPQIHAHFAALTRQPITYEAFDVAPVDLIPWVTEFFAAGGSGLNVTVPHKAAVLTLADHLTTRARQAGAVNTLARQSDGSVLGDNTDGAGWVADLAQRGLELRDRSILILGAGGAVRGLLGPLLEQQPASVQLLNRTVERARRLTAEFAEAADRVGAQLSVVESAQPVTTVDWIVHASSLGHDAAVDETPGRWPASAIGPATVACDLSYGEAARPFCDWAYAQGTARCFDGLGMLIEQAAEAFAVWRGVRPDTTALRTEWLTTT